MQLRINELAAGIVEKALKPLWFQGFLAHVASLTCRFGAFAEAAGKSYQGQINYKTAQNALFKAQQENKSAEEIKQLQETTDLAKKECDVAGGGGQSGEDRGEEAARSGAERLIAIHV